MVNKHKNVLLIFLFAIMGVCSGIVAFAADMLPCKDQDAAKKCTHQQSAADRTGEARKGKASYYGREFYGKKMANGKPMNPRSNVAASKTLPLGTKAKVTNLDTGKSAVVDIEDRGPYVKNRIVDLSPKVAEELDIKEKGVAPVVVDPISIPSKDDSKKSDTKGTSGNTK
ncbi:MAG TPA: septal ring lytic transglycosylase RlpA family protein [Burkholderiaceae bacterium]